MLLDCSVDGNRIGDVAGGLAFSLFAHVMAGRVDADVEFLLWFKPCNSSGVISSGAGSFFIVGRERLAFTTERCHCSSTRGLSAATSVTCAQSIRWLVHANQALCRGYVRLVALVGVALRLNACVVLISNCAHWVEDVFLCRRFLQHSRQNTAYI